jgi:hypothetical protein
VLKIANSQIAIKSQKRVLAVVLGSQNLNGFSSWHGGKEKSFGKKVDSRTIIITNVL